MLELDMGTGFDNFSDTAHQNFKNLPLSALENRMLLKTTMEKFGFKSYVDEWWHYAWPEAPKYEILNIGFKQLEKNYRGIASITASIFIVPYT